MGTMNKKRWNKIKKLWKKLNKEKALLWIILILLILYGLRIIAGAIYVNTRDYQYVDYEGKFGNSHNCGLIYNQKGYCRVNGKWHPVQTYWEE
jgi:capsule polysaccharide export protein KpsE/RkpR